MPGVGHKDPLVRKAGLYWGCGHQQCRGNNKVEIGRLFQRTNGLELSQREWDRLLRELQAEFQEEQTGSGPERK